jgi:SOS response regulatory protein OraA/RecX
MQRARSSLQSIASAVPVLELSSRRETGMDAWIDWLHAEKLANDRRCAASKAKAHMHAHHDHRT